MSPSLSRREFLRLMGLMPLLNLPGASSRSSAQAQSPNVLVLVFDALSAHHMSLYGNARETTPHMAAFAARSNLYLQNYSPGSFTSPGSASILTGLYPAEHRAFQAYATIDPAYREQNLFSLFSQAGYHTLSFSQNLLANILLHDFISGTDERIPADIATLASKELSDNFFDADYGVAVQAERTALSPLGQFPNSLFLSLISEYVGRRNVANLPKELRELFPRGFPQNHDMYYLLEDVVDWMMDYLPRLPQPFASYIHFMPPHDPYHPRQEFIGRFADQPLDLPAKPEHFFSEGRDAKFLDNKREQYDEYIAYVDAEFGRLITHLEESGLLDNTVVVLTSDHGELFERGIYRHITPVLYEGISRVPLAIRFPSQNLGRRIEAPTSNVDILPTLLAAAGLSQPPNLDGLSLSVPESLDPNRPLFTMDAKSNAKFGPLRIGTIAAIQNRRKLIHYFGYGGYESEFEFYNLEQDPQELENRYSENDPEVVALQEEINRLRE